MAKDKASDKDEKATTKKRAKRKEKRRIVVLVVNPRETDQGGGINPTSYHEAGKFNAAVEVESQPDEGHATSIDALKWIKANGAALKGKTLVIASMTKPRELKEKAPVTPNFDFG